MQIDMILKRFEQPDESREMTLGKFEVVHLGWSYDRSRDVSAGMEMVDLCRARCRPVALPVDASFHCAPAIDRTRRRSQSFSKRAMSSSTRE
jgi:hypothetical protein